MLTQSLITALTLLATLTSAAPTAAKSTLITSTSFGIDPLQPSTSGGNQNVTDVLYDPANAHTGNGYLSVAFPATTDKQYVTYVYGLHLAKSTSYTASVWAKSPNPTGDCYVAIGFHGNDGNLLNLTSEVVGKKYEEYKITVKSGAATGSAGAAYFYVTCTGGKKEVVFVDDLKLERM